MNPLLINTSDKAGGASIACYRLCRALRKQGLNANMFVKEKNGLEEWILRPPENFRNGELTHYLEKLSFLPYEKDKSIRFQFSNASFGVDISRDPAVKAADLLHFHWINKGFLSFRSLENLAKLQKPVVWTCHDMWAFTGGCHYSGSCFYFEGECGNCMFLKNPGPKDLSHRIWRKKRELYQKLNLHIVTCSQWLGDHARNSGLLKDVPVTVIPNPIDTAVFKPAPKTSTGKKTVLFQAMNLNDERKGFRYLLDALQILRQKHPDFSANLKILLFGKTDPSSLSDIPFETEYLGLLKEEAAIVKAYQQADIFVIPSLEENLPNTIMEAMACGKPVVAFASGGIPEMVRHRHNGWLAPVRDASALADGIYETLQSPSFYQELSENARKWVVANYSEEVVADKYGRVYNGMMR